MLSGSVFYAFPLPKLQYYVQNEKFICIYHKKAVHLQPKMVNAQKTIT